MLSKQIITAQLVRYSYVRSVCEIRSFKAVLARARNSYSNVCLTKHFPMHVSVQFRAGAFEGNILKTESCIMLKTREEN
jgi:hypothetical protein